LLQAFSTSSPVSAECAASYPNEPAGRVSTTTMKFIVKEEQPVIPMYRVMDRQGNILDESQDPKVILSIFFNAKRETKTQLSFIP
jgi:hypothetical protein